MKNLLFILFIFFNNYIFSALPLRETLEKINNQFNANYIGLNYQVQFSMKTKLGINGDPSYCFGSLVVIKDIKYLITSTGCLIRKGTKLQLNTYYATGYKIVYGDKEISEPINFKYNNVKANSILLIKLPPDLPDVPFNTLQLVKHSTNMDLMKNRYELIISRLQLKYSTDSTVNDILFSQYYTITDQVLKTSPVLISVFDKVNPSNALDDEFIYNSYLKDNKMYYNGVTIPLYTYILYDNHSYLKTSYQIFKFNDNFVIRDLGASLIVCLNINHQIDINKCYSIGILTSNKENHPYFSFFSAQEIYLLNNQARTLTLTDIFNLS